MIKLAEEHLIFKCVAGSRSYGTNSVQSDHDTRGIFIAPPDYVLGCLKGIEQVEASDEDTVLYELGKFVKLAAECNPNIIELLYTDSSNILFIHPAFETFRNNRHLFLSKKARFTFSGYAIAQLKRIRGHNKWINSPQPETPPDILDFATIIYPNGLVGRGKELDGLQDVFLVKVNATTFRIFSHPTFSKPPLSKDRMNIQYIDVSDSKLVDVKYHGTIIIQEDTYRVQHRMWKDYWKWKRERNEQRSILEEQHGFDTKHAMHLVRLLRMSHEILKDGNVVVLRPDADELLDIRNGKWTYEELVTTAERMDAELEALYEKSSLPHSANKEEINALYMKVVLEYWKAKGLL